MTKFIFHHNQEVLTPLVEDDRPLITGPDQEITFDCVGLYAIQRSDEYLIYRFLRNIRNLPRKKKKKVKSIIRNSGTVTMKLI